MAMERTRTPMSDQHKAALAEGRDQGRTVRRYLEALELHRPRRGRRRTHASITARLAKIEAELETAGPLQRLHLFQERLDLTAELDGLSNRVDLTGLEAEFVAAAAEYSRRKGLSYEAWRALGVAPGVLKRAGIRR